MDLSFTEEEERYRKRVREFLKENLPQGWGTPGYELPRGEALVEMLRDLDLQGFKYNCFRVFSAIINGGGEDG